MPYTCPFTPDQKIIEIGGGPGLPGGEQPLFRPNIDVRPGPMVDIVHDLEQTPWPLASHSYDGVYSSFCLEHVSYRRIGAFIEELYRILSPGGIAVLVTADTYQQCLLATQTPPELWGEWISSMLFGDQNYSDNTHKVALSRSYAAKLFQASGFYRVETLDHPGIMGPDGHQDVKTDFIIEAHKSRAQITY